MRTLLGALLSAILVTSAHATGVEPKKPSQLVQIQYNTSSPTLCPNGHLALDQLVAADGTVSPFTIPDGQVLVITEARLGQGIHIAGRPVLVLLERSSAAGTNIIAAEAAVDDAAGLHTSVFTFPTGAIVKAGTNICIFAKDVLNGTNLFVGGQVYGFLTPDK
jgi:hypothetical protein